ncbi:MAG: DUF6162 family protein [Cereibacter changlensis]
MSGLRLIVPPASGRRETLAVAALVAAIAVGAVAVVSLHRETAEASVLPGWQIDLRHELNAAEQGLTADLLNAVAEIPFLDDPSAESLAGEGIPPFAQDATAENRGGHVWQEIPPDAGGNRGWIGIPAAPERARSLLLRLADDTPAVWLAEAADAPPALDDAALIRVGWRQVSFAYAASVTREVRP